MEALSFSDWAALAVALIGAGLFGGLIAGLFGVGGGTVMVPALFCAFELLGVGGESNLHVAIGSSLLTIVATSWRSLAAHRAHGAVDETVLRTWTPWVAFGALIGAGIAGMTSMANLGWVYGVCLILVAAQMALTPDGWKLAGDLPTGWGRRVIATTIGGLSAMMGIGGGSLGGMTMTLFGRPIHQAVATASGFGFAIGLAATLGFVLFGWGAPGRPPLSLGYVNVPAAITLGLLTTAVAPFGARLAHRLDKTVLRRAFAVYLTLAAVAVLIKAL